jgi:putative oxidoreductase
MTTAALSRCAPLPLRIALGVGLMIHGGIKLFADGGHDNIVHLVTQLGVPFAEPMGWVVGVVEFAGGAALLLGVLFGVAAVANALNVGALLVLGALAGGIPEPLPGGDPLPQFREAFLILAGTVSLWLSGPGRFALADLWRRKRGTG